MNILGSKREHAEDERAERLGGGALSRRGLLGGLAALPVLYGVGSVAPALAATPTRPGGVSSGSVPKATDDLVRGVERRYNAPLLTPGTRLVLPAGIKAVPIQNYYRHPHLASAESAWPHMTATDGTTVDVVRYGANMPTASFNGDIDLAALWCGESAALVNDVKPAGDIVREIARDADTVLAAMAR